MRGSLGLLALLWPLALHGGEPPAPTFTAQTALVRVDFEVLDGMTPVAGLTAANLRVFDAGKPQPVHALTEAQMPLDLVLLFDISGSMEPIVEKVSAVTAQALSELRGGDRVAVMTFSDHTRLLLRLTGDLERVARTVRERVLGGSFDGGTRLLAGVDDAARYFLSEPRGPRRRAIIVITDNLGIRSRKESTVVNRLWEADATLHGLVIASRLGNAMKWYMRITAPYMEALNEGIGGSVAKTGGTLITARGPTEAFPELIRRIRARPALYYVMPPGPEGKYRPIKVELAPELRRQYPNARVYARRGYHVPLPGARPAADILAQIVVDEESAEDGDEDDDDRGDEAREPLKQEQTEDPQGSPYPRCRPARLL